MELFYELFNRLPRQGPGDDESTQKAIRMIPGLPVPAHVLDIGCGSGMQTIGLAKKIEGMIVALDNHQPFLDELNLRARREGVSDTIKTVNGSMFALEFTEGSFDLIWSEGAIYIIGFERGLREFKPLLKRNGYMAVTEVCWLKTDAPPELRSFWETEYPAIKTIRENEEIIHNEGYDLIGNFVLPESSWWVHHYQPLGERLEEMRREYGTDPQAVELFDSVQYEIDIFREYTAWYGYVFFVMRSRG